MQLIQSDVIAKMIYFLKHKLTHYVGISQTNEKWYSTFIQTLRDSSPRSEDPVMYSLSRCSEPALVSLFLLNSEEDILKNVGNQLLMVPIDFNSMETILWKSMGTIIIIFF